MGLYETPISEGILEYAFIEIGKIDLSKAVLYGDENRCYIIFERR